MMHKKNASEKCAAARAAGRKTYFTGQPCKHGHICERYVKDNRCVKCYERRKQEIIEGRRNDPVKRQRSRDAYNRWAKTSAGKKTRRKSFKRWLSKNRDRVNNWQRERRLVDVNFKLRMQLRIRINDAIRSDQKAGSAVRDLGCSIDFLRQYLEAQFQPEMSWDNHGKLWEIDHIRPLATFDLSVKKQFLKACHYMNLRPLLRSENLERRSEFKRVA